VALLFLDFFSPLTQVFEPILLPVLSQKTKIAERNSLTTKERQK
jgi:hypothetical protein